MDLKEREYECVGCNNMAQDRNHWQDVVNMIMNLQVQLTARNHVNDYLPFMDSMP
jgi:hypothetical protein